MLRLGHGNLEHQAKGWGGGVLAVTFHFWLGCPWLARCSGAATISEPRAAPLVTYASPLQGMLSRPLLGFISAETSWLLLVDQFPPSNSEVCPETGKRAGRWRSQNCGSSLET